MITDDKIAELATKVVVAAASSNSPNIRWDGDSLCILYERMYDVIKRKDQE